jgi:hypothetical protein
MVQRGRRHRTEPATIRAGVVSLALCSVLSAGCRDEPGPERRRPVAVVGDETLDESVVEHIAKRDGVDPDAARKRATDTLLLVAGSREERSALPGEPTAELTAGRRRHLLRNALARLWLETYFEPRHGPEHVPEEAMGPFRGRVIHPAIHFLCQIVVRPAVEGEHAPTGFAGDPDDPKWRERALAFLRPVRERMVKAVPVGHPDACKIMGQLVGLERHEVDGLRLHFEGAGYELGACVEFAQDGGCDKYLLVREWADEVRKADGHGFLEPFFSRWGLHLVYMKDIVPERTAEDPTAESELRQIAHPRWQTKAFLEYMDRLRKERGVRVAGDVQAFGPPGNMDGPP